MQNPAKAFGEALGDVERRQVGAATLYLSQSRPVMTSDSVYRENLVTIGAKAVLHSRAKDPMWTMAYTVQESVNLPQTLGQRRQSA